MHHRVFRNERSLRSHGHQTKEMRNGVAPEIHKKGIHKDCPQNVPRKIHGILVCQKCKTTWNRDVVGATNILDIYLARMEGHQRPARFTRAYWQKPSDSQLQGRGEDMGSDNTVAGTCDTEEKSKTTENVDFA